MENDMRLQERLLLDPPIDCLFGSSRVIVGDLSGVGARLRHDAKLDPGSRAPLHLAPGVSCESEVVWCMPSASTYAFESGVRLFSEAKTIRPFLEHLIEDGRTRRVEERRKSSRYSVVPGHSGNFEGAEVRVADISSRGVRVVSPQKFEVGHKGRFLFIPSGDSLIVDVSARVVWCTLQSIWGEGERHYDAGLAVLEMHGLMRAAIGALSEAGGCVKDTRSLVVKARLENLEGEPPELEEGIDRESGGRISLVRRVRSRLESDPIERDRWLHQADLAAQHPMIRGLAGPIVEHREALAAWEFLDRSIDPSLVTIAFD